MKRATDPFDEVRKATAQHRARHGCGTHPYGNGPLLGVLAATVQARRILELGTALGYTALSFAYGAPNSMVDTIERDPQHVQLARANIAGATLDHRINEIIRETLMTRGGEITNPRVREFYGLSAPALKT